MKKLLKTIFTLSLLGLVFISCKKNDEETVLENTITIDGTFMVGGKTFTNPTFDLGYANDLEAYIGNNSVVLNLVENEIDLGDNIFLNYDIQIEPAAVGSQNDNYAYIFIKKLGEDSGFNLICYNAKSTITKIGNIGEFIEGTYEGEFTVQGEEMAPMNIKANFKVKRIAETVK